MNQRASTAITHSKLCQLADLEPNYLSRHCADFPLPSVPVHTGRAGRPELAIPLDALAEFILAHTSHLTDAECRLRAALAVKRRRPRKPTDIVCRIVADAAGRLVACPEYTVDLECLSPADRADAEQALAFERSQQEEQP